MADYTIGGVAVILVVYSAVSYIVIFSNSFKGFTYYAALPTMVILAILYFTHRHIYKLRNSN